MNKFFTLLAALVTAATASAQVPQLFFGEEPVEPGKVYETGYTVESMDFGGGWIVNFYTQDADLYIRALLGEDVTVEVNATSSVSVCSLNSLCIDGVYVKKEAAFGSVSTVVDPDDDDYGLEALEIHIKKDDNLGPVTLENVTVKVKAYYTDNPSQSVETEVVLRNIPQSELGGIDNAVIDNGSISYDMGNRLVYNMPQPTKLDIYNVNGSLVMSQKVYSTGTVSLDALHPGVYVYSAGCKCGKILVR